MFHAAHTIDERDLRRNVDLDVQAIRADGQIHKVKVTDISRDGCQLRTDASLAIGEEVTLKHEVLGDVVAQVRWASGGRAGMLFLRRL